jgi:hypothetical protein
MGAVADMQDNFVVIGIKFLGDAWNGGWTAPQLLYDQGFGRCDAGVLAQGV